MLRIARENVHRVAQGKPPKLLVVPGTSLWYSMAFSADDEEEGSNQRWGRDYIVEGYPENRADMFVRRERA